jgi:CDP-2,3-bis-(O-geranylgeranyl)-sn-glycerol synthase
VDWSFLPQALWLFIPAYAANMTPVFAARILPRWNAPIDGGKLAKDGRPILGRSKTWRGLASGALVGALAAYLQSFIRHTERDWSDFGYGLFDNPVVPITVGLFMGLGTGVGDAVKSYYKRRADRPSGAPWVPFDQLDFVVGGLLFALLASLLLQPVAGTNWWWDEFGGDAWPKLVVLVVLTPFLHFLVNVIGYKLKLKAVPW